MQFSTFGWRILCERMFLLTFLKCDDTNGLKTVVRFIFRLGESGSPFGTSHVRKLHTGSPPVSNGCLLRQAW